MRHAARLHRYRHQHDAPAGGRGRRSERARGARAAGVQRPGHGGSGRRHRRRANRRVAVAVADHARSARAAGARRIRAVATAGVRDATNAAALLDAVAAASGLRATVLSGVEEARLAFVGATHSARLLAPDEVVGVADVGGGSTELVVGTPAGGVSWSVSLPVGSAVVGACCALSDPPSRVELDSAREHVEEAFAGVRPPPSTRCLAVGGSATSLWRLVGQPLDAGALGRALERLTASPSSDVARKMDLDPRRARLLPAGILVLERRARPRGPAADRQRRRARGGDPRGAGRNVTDARSVRSSPPALRARAAFTSGPPSSSWPSRSARPTPSRRCPSRPWRPPSRGTPCRPCAGSGRPPWAPACRPPRRTCPGAC